MVKKFLKIAGVKSEAEFYKKYPSEAAFFKAHPEAKDLKQYKQGGQQKKLNQLTSYQGDIDNIIPIAQDGITGKNCRGKSWRPTLGGDGGSGSGGTGCVDNAPVTSKQLIASGYDTGDKKAIKQRAKALEADFPGITADEVAMAMGDSARVKAKLWNLPNIDKNIQRYNELKGTDINAAHQSFPYSDYFFNYYRPYLNTGADGKPMPLTVPEILSAHSSPAAYRQAVDRNYKQKKGGKLPKGQNAFSTMNTPSIPTSGLTNAYDPSLIYGNQTLQGAVPIGGQTPSAVQAIANEPLNKNKFDWDKAGQMAGPIAGVASKIGKGIQANKAEKKAMLQAKQSKAVSDVALQAASTRPEADRRMYNRPEDALIQPEQLFPTYGVGTNVLAEDGAEVTRGGIGGNPTEIQNMYNPYDLYMDLGYEPLNDSERVKQYAYGGMTRAQAGIMAGLGKFGSAGGFDAVGKGLDMIPGMNNAGGQIGEGIGEAVGMIPGVGTVAKPILKLAGKAIGAAFDRKPQKTKIFNEQAFKNVTAMGLMQGGADIQSANENFVKNGGYISHDWQPQVIASFGGHRVSDLLRRDPMMDTLRTGGHITQNYTSPMDQFTFGGELKTHWGGYAETMSQNPYLPGSGETVMFRGQSHDESDGKGRTGIGVSYGSTGHDSYTDYAEYGTDAATDKANVEVERSEPAVQLPDESGQNNMVVYGNLKIPNQFLSEIGDPNAKGKKFKHYVRDLTKNEAKQNKIIEKNLNIIDSLDDITTFNQMKFFSAKANIDGANMKLKKLAEYKINAAAVQNAINDTAEENMMDADALAKGKYKVDKEAMKGYAQKGTKWPKGQEPGVETKLPDGTTKVTYKDGTYTIKRKGAHDLYDKNGKLVQTISFKDFNSKNVDRLKIIPSAPVDESMYTTEKKEDVHYPITPRKEQPWIDAVNQLQPLFMPTDQEAFDMAQLYPEMFAMASNQLEPVPAQLYRPQLRTPYDISLQDVMNQNQADFNTMQRMTGYNPGAQSQLSAEKYAANQKVLGEQFRQNQAMKAQVYGENINTLNDAQLKNLGILQDQYAKQSEAKSKTKATTQAALNSIADKIAKNKLENKTLGIYENLYNFRFDKQGRAINMNPLFKPTIPDVSNTKPLIDSKGNIIGYIQGDEIDPTKKASTTTTNSTTKRNGGLVKAFKNF